MKVKLGQLRQLVKEELTQARKGGGRAALGFAIPEDSPDYGVASPSPTTEPPAEAAPAPVSKKDKKVLDLLTNVFTMTVNMEDVRYIRYKVRKNAVSLIDVGEQLGHMQTGASTRELASAGLTPQQLGDWLAANGARPQKAVRRKRNAFSGPMGGYD